MEQKKLKSILCTEDDRVSRTGSVRAQPGRYIPKTTLFWSSAVLVSSLAFTVCCATSSDTYPAQYVIINPLNYTVMGTKPARNNSYTDYFNPTNTSPPFFQIFDPAFLDILGPSAYVRAIASNATFAFAHEAPIYNPKTDELFFVSNDGGALGMSDLYNNNQISMINLTAADEALAASGGMAVNVNITKLLLPDTVQMTNGGTGPYKGSLLFVNSGRGELPPSMTLINPYPPYNVTVLLDNFLGRQFNSLNDIKIHPSGILFFTDTTYGWLNHFRPEPLLPSQVYRFDPSTGSVRVVADGFVRCNGIALSRDGRTAYITDTGAAGGFLGNNQTLPATIYVFDIDEHTQMFSNRRVFAYADSGVPDGIQVDDAGNVWSGCGDATQVWNSAGTLIGKIFVGSTATQVVFAGQGRVLILAETTVYMAKTATVGNYLNFP